MDKTMVDSLIKNYAIDDLVEYVKNLDEPEQDEAKAYLLKQLSTTDEYRNRDMLSITLSELECQDAVEILIELIFDPRLADQDMCTLVWSLSFLECSQYYKKLLPLLFAPSYAVRWSMYPVMEHIFPKLSEEEKQWCMHYVEKQMEDYETMLQQVYYVYEDIMGGVIEEE